MDTVVIADIEYQELLKIQKKYNALMTKSVIYLSNCNIHPTAHGKTQRNREKS